MRNKVLGWLGVALLTLLTLLYFLWTYNPVSFRDIGYRIISDFEVEVDFDLTRLEGTPVRCQIEALNSSFAVVGWKEFSFPASDQLTDRYTVKITTTQQAVTGLVRSCQLN